MPNATSSPARINARRLLLWTVGLFPAVLALVVFGFWLESTLPAWVYWKAALIFLIAAGWIYGVSLAVALPATLVLGFLVLQGRRAGRARSRMARPLTFCISLLLVSVAAEATTRAVGTTRASQHRVARGRPGRRRSGRTG